MGEVYRATDTILKRQVAIKVLPEVVASDAERIARFQREAEVLASLNHPNIATIYGLEKSDHLIALVMELVEGPTLAERLAKGPVPIDEALQIASQIAEALAQDGGAIYMNEAARAAELGERHAQIDDELMAALERWEELGSSAAR